VDSAVTILPFCRFVLGCRFAVCSFDFALCSQAAFLRVDYVVLAADLVRLFAFYVCVVAVVRLPR